MMMLDRTKLLAIANRGFSLSNLQDVCFDLGFDWEGIPGETKPAKARELVLMAERLGRLANLELSMRRINPDTFLSDPAVTTDNRVAPSVSSITLSESGRSMRVAPQTVDLLDRFIATTFTADRVVYVVATMMDELRRTLDAILRSYQEGRSGGLVSYIRLAPNANLELEVNFQRIADLHESALDLLAQRKLADIVPYGVRDVLRKLSSEVAQAMLVLRGAESFAVRYMAVIDLREILDELDRYECAVSAILEDMNEQR
jgi:hypothetical protein